jgi:hypothetical protein
MISRILFLLIAAFWVAMNVLLWRAEYGSHGSEIAVPVRLVWHKILTAPDPSSLSVYQNGEKTGFAEFSTGVEQEMAALDADKVPPPRFPPRAGYQIRVNGNVGWGDFTNRVKFDGRIQFGPDGVWRELNLKITARDASLGISAATTNQIVSVQMTGAGVTAQREFTFQELQNPTALLHWLDRNFGDGWLDELNWPVPLPNPTTFSSGLRWEAHLDRLRLGHTYVSVYRLRTSVLEHPIVIDVSTLGEILRVELPGGLVAAVDEWSEP